jgi:hypothetical protein
LFFEVVAEDGITIAQQVAREPIERKRVPQLLAGPLRSGMTSYVEMNDATTTAREIENRLTERLLSFLKSDAEVFDRLGAAAESPASSGQLVAAARKFASRWSSFRSDELRDLLTSFVRRVIIQQNNIEVLISRTDLRQVLEKGDEFVPTNLDRPQKSVHPDDLICLTIEAKLKRSGGEVHLVIPPNSSEVFSHQPNPSLMKAVARARGWYERVLEGKSSDPKIADSPRRNDRTLHRQSLWVRVPRARHRRSHSRGTSTSRPNFQKPLQQYSLELDRATKAIWFLAMILSLEFPAPYTYQGIMFP